MFLTCAVNVFFENFCIEILYVIALALPKQSQSLSVNGAFFDLVALCKRPLLTPVYDIGSGFGSFGRILSSYFIGTTQPGLVTETIRKSCVYVSLIGAVFALLVLAFREGISNMFFKGDTETAELFSACLLIGVAHIPVYSIIILVTSYFW